MNKMKDLVWLFGINMFISAFTFGGGYVVIPMIKKYYVEKKGYFDEDELMKIECFIRLSCCGRKRTAGKLYRSDFTTIIYLGDCICYLFPDS